MSLALGGPLRGPPAPLMVPPMKPYRSEDDGKFLLLLMAIPIIQLGIWAASFFLGGKIY